MSHFTDRPRPTGRWPAAAFVVLWTTLSTPVGAYEQVACRGEPLRWASSRVALRANGCTVFGERLRVVREAVAAWNLIGAGVRLELVEPGLCTRPRRDGVNVVSYVPGHEIDGALGVTRRYYSNRCSAWLPHPDIDEADVLLNADNPPLLPEDRGPCPGGNARAARDCRAWEALPPCGAMRQQTVRNTTLHELGHLLGLQHFDDALGVMMTWNGEARYCDSRPWGPMPDDIRGVRRAYGRAGPPILELSVIGQRWIAPDRLFPVGQTPDEDELLGIPAAWRGVLQREPLPDRSELSREVCAGALIRVQSSTANRGTVAGTYRTHWFASPDRALSPDDLRLAVSGRRAIGAGHVDVVERSIRVSRWLDPAVDYHLLYLVEPSWRWSAERRQGDNTGILPGTLRRMPEGRCR